MLRALLNSTLLRASALTIKQYSLVEGASLLLDLRELLVTVSLSSSLLLAQLLDDALALSSLTTVLALLSETDPIRIFSHLRNLIGDQLDFAFVGALQLLLDFLDCELVLGALVGKRLQALLDGRGRGGIWVAIDFNIKADGLCDLAGDW